MGAGVNTFPAQDAALFSNDEFECVVEGEYIAGTDTDTCSAIDTFALVERDPVFEDLDISPEP